jgi:cephalosporin hydroxylase
MDPIQQFNLEVLANIQGISKDHELGKASNDWLTKSLKHNYSYNFKALGRPVIQYPQDLVALQEIIWDTRPDLIIETGIAHGGSLILSASMLSLLDYCDAVESGTTLDPKTAHRKVLGIDIDIRPHNRVAIEAHPMAHRIEMMEGSSIAVDIIEKVRKFAKPYEKILVILDSNHTHDHVLAELEAYAPFTSKGSYCVVFDTVVEDLPEAMFPNRPWSKGNNPKTAVWEYLRRLKNSSRTAVDGAQLSLEIDYTIESKLLITVAPDGYLKRIG